MDLPYKNIESFTVVDAEGKPLTASIVEDRIVLYWPPYQKVPASIAPTIKVSGGASISPASGVEVAINPDEPVRYTVTAQDGSTRIYTLDLNINQPVITASIGIATEPKQYALFSTNNSVPIWGEYFLTEEGATKVYLIDQQGKETQLELLNGKVESTGFNAIIPNDTPLGTYRFKVVSGIRSVITETFEVVRPSLGLVISDYTGGTASLRRGQTFSLAYKPDLLEQYYKEDMEGAVFVLTDDLRTEHILAPVFDKANGQIIFTIPQAVVSGRLRAVILRNSSGESIRYNVNVRTITIID